MLFDVFTMIIHALNCSKLGRGTYDAAILWMLGNIKEDPAYSARFPMTFAEIRTADEAKFDGLLGSILSLDAHHIFLALKNQDLMLFAGPKDKRTYDLSREGVQRARELDDDYGEFAGFFGKRSTLLDGPSTEVWTVIASCEESVCNRAARLSCNLCKMQGQPFTDAAEVYKALQ